MALTKGQPWAGPVASEVCSEVWKKLGPEKKNVCSQRATCVSCVLANVANEKESWEGSHVQLVCLAAGVWSWGFLPLGLILCCVWYKNISIWWGNLLSFNILAFVLKWIKFWCSCMYEGCLYVSSDTMIETLITASYEQFQKKGMTRVLAANPVLLSLLFKFSKWLPLRLRSLPVPCQCL